MTTIAVNRKMMVCDSRTSFDSGEFYVCDDKVERINGELVGCAGKTSECFKFLHWFKNRESERPELEDFEAVVLNKSGIYHYNNSTYASRVAEPYFAIGSGSMAARVAMDCDKNPEEAVRIAIKRDKNSGPPVRVFLLSED